MATQVSEAVAATILQAQRTGMLKLSLSEFATNTEGQVQQGSLIEVSGSLFQSTSDESISGLSSFSDGDLYILATPSGSSLSYSYTDVTPVWFSTKQGFYDATGSNRYVGGGTKAGANFTNKWLYCPLFNNNSENIKMYGNGKISCDAITKNSFINSYGVQYNEIVIPIGDWVTHSGATGYSAGKNFLAADYGIDINKVIYLEAWVRPDSDVTPELNPLNGGYTGGSYYWGYVRISDTYPGYIRVYAPATGFGMDTGDYEETSYNRGWIKIGYLVN